MNFKRQIINQIKLKYNLTSNFPSKIESQRRFLRTYLPYKSFFEI